MSFSKILRTAAVGLVLSLVLSVASASAQSGRVLAAAASNMKFAFDELIRVFHKAHPEIRVQTSFGSSGNFFGQIRHGAPYDIFFSADMAYPRKLQEADQGHPGSKVTPYAVGQIVVWVSTDSGIDVQKEKMRALLNAKVARAAIANPAHAPYGRAAMEAMKYSGILETVRSRLVFGENITQAAQFVHTGAAQAGILALSLAVTEKMQSVGTYWRIPLKSYAAIRQGYLVLKNAANPAGAKRFAEFVTGPRGAAILERYGFALPGEESLP